MKICVSSILCLFSVILVSGCGGDQTQPDSGPSSTTPEATTNTGKNGASVPTRQTKSSTLKQHRPNERWTDGNGVEYLGNVPLDVFFDKPLEVASNVTPLAGATALASSDSAPEQPEANLQNSMASSPDSVATLGADSESGSQVSTVEGDEQGTGGWEKVLPAQVLTDEVNAIRNFMNSSLQSVGTYNNSMLSIPERAASLAVLAEVAINHPEEISWKEDAIYIRDLAKQMNDSTLQRGKKDQSRLLILFENIGDTLNRSRPAGLDEPDAEESFSDVGEMRLLMLRMKESERRLRTEAGSQSAFENKKEMVKHEAAIMQAMTKIISLDEYGYADDEEFMGYSNALTTACDTIQDAADSGTYSAYDLALSKISTNCQQCHSAFKNN